MFVWPDQYQASLCIDWLATIALRCSKLAHKKAFTVVQLSWEINIPYIKELQKEGLM